MAAIDAGGPYRDTIEHVCQDLMSPACPLFLPAPNARAGLGENRDCFVPNPACVSPLCLAQYEFVGMLLGLALRTRYLLSLNFPSLFWKALVGEALTLDDVQAIDMLTANALKELMDPALSPHASPEVFNQEMADVYFTAMGSDHQARPLCLGGERKSLTFENRAEYARLKHDFHLHEFDAQTAAVRTGLGKVIPLSVLCMFTGVELAGMVCGRGMTREDVDLLEKMTEFEDGSFNHNSQEVKWLFEILRDEFTTDQRGQYLTFVWGRSRLPRNEKDFDEKHKINRNHNNASHNSDDEAEHDDNVNKMFPMAHTCFFTIDLPKYTDRAAMLQRLLTAISSCGVIDGD